MPLSYYRLVAWPWMVLWQVGWLTLLGWGMIRLRQFQRPVVALGHGLDWVMAATGLTLVVASLMADFPRVALWNTSLVVSYGLGLYAYRNWVDGGGWLTRYRLWAGLVGVAAGTAIVSLGLWRPDPTMWQSQNFMTALRNYQPLGHHNFVGGYFALILPLAVAAAVASRGGQRWLAAGASGLMAVALYASGSRGAALGALVWLLVTWLARLARVSRKHRWRCGLAGLGGFTAVGLALATNPRIRAWFEVSPGAGSIGLTVSDGPTLDRWFMVQMGGNILRDRPLFGVGPGVMSRVSNLYRPIEAGAGLDHIQQLHNTPLQLAGELGLAGLGLYLAWLVLGGRLWWWLWQQPLTPPDRALLGGIGGSLLAYGVSSLTDYQLENIPIAGTLVALVVLLLALATTYGRPGPAVSLPRRRLASLGVWIWIGLLFYIWLPFTLTVSFAALADRAFYNQQLNLADTRWYKADRLSPWDPTAGAVASEALWKLYQMLGASETQDNVRSLLLDYAHQAQRAAPNDAWFNQNLAVFHQPLDPAQALPFAAQAVQLLPRNRNHGYWLLGELLLAQDAHSGTTTDGGTSPKINNQPDAAIAAFTLEALINPASLTYPLWQEEPFQAIYPAVVTSTLGEYDQLLAQLSPGDLGFSAVYEARVLLAWWTRQSLSNVRTDYLRPIVQALLLADTDPAAALTQVESALAAGQDTVELRLLAAWLDPQKYWSAYANPDSSGPDSSGPDSSIPDLNTLMMEENLTQRPLRTWLTAMVAAPAEAYRGAISFAYRNYQAKEITLMLQPQDLQLYTLVTDLNLFPQWPREFPLLDHRIEALRTEALGLPHPTRNRFRLSSLSVQE